MKTYRSTCGNLALDYMENGTMLLSGVGPISEEIVDQLLDGITLRPRYESEKQFKEGVSFPKKLIIDEGISEIGNCAFSWYCGEIQLPSTVKYIGRRAFQHALPASSSGIVIPEGCVLDYWAFTEYKTETSPIYRVKETLDATKNAFWTLTPGEDRPQIIGYSFSVAQIIKNDLSERGWTVLVGHYRWCDDKIALIEDNRLVGVCYIEEDSGQLGRRLYSDHCWKWEKRIGCEKDLCENHKFDVN